MTSINELLKKYPKTNYVDIEDNCETTFSFHLNESINQWVLDEIVHTIAYANGIIWNMRNGSFEPRFDDIREWSNAFKLKEYDEDKDGGINTLTVIAPYDFEGAYNIVYGNGKGE